MDNGKIENKVVLTLEEFLKMRDSKIESDKNVSELVNLLFNCVELNSDKTDLRLETYYIKKQRLMVLLKELDPERYQRLLETLKKEKGE